MSNARSKLSSSRTVATFIRHGTCSETLCNVVDRAFGHPLPIEEHASAPLAGGIMAHGYQCGQVWGAALAAGAQAHRLLGSGPQAETAAITAAQRIVGSFGARYGSIDCRAIIGVDFGDPSQNALKVAVQYFARNGVKCFRMAAQYAPLAMSDIEGALAEGPGEVPPPPVSCAAEVARRLGASDLHAVMAAGLAGGIGLSGDACGALAAAIWMTDMNDRQHGTAKVGYTNPRAASLIGRFVKHTDSRFTCLDLVGRRFESAADHAAYLHDGGCAEIIDVAVAH
jgi:hypothetical protein